MNTDTRLAELQEQGKRLAMLQEQGKLWAQFAAAAISANVTKYSNLPLALEIADRALAGYNERFNKED